MSKTKKLQVIRKDTRSEPRLKNVSAPLVILLSLLNRFTDGAYLDDVVAEYQELGFDISKMSVCTYLNRAKRMGYITVTHEQEGTVRHAVYNMNETGREKLKWWKDLVTNE